MDENKNSCSQIIQGDVFLTASKVDFKNLKKLSHVTLALGEATGHHHTVTEIPAGMSADLYQSGDGTLYLRVEGEGKVGLTHQEHNEVRIPAGDFEVGIQQEYDPFAEEARRVVD